MPNYSLRIPGGEVETENNLDLTDDGTFSLSIYVWDTMAGGGFVVAAGRWTRTGDTITFEIKEKANSYPRMPTTATVVGGSLDVAHFGMFS
jgi:hypothetical protein